MRVRKFNFLTFTPKLSWLYPLILSFAVIFYCASAFSNPSEVKETNKKLILSYKRLVKILSQENDIKKAEEYLLTFTQNETYLNQLITNCSKGQIEGFKSNFFNSNFHFFEALKFAQKLKSNYFRYEIYQNIAKNYRQQNKLKEAIQYYKKALDYVSRNNKPTDEPLLYNNLGLAFLHENKLDSAKFYFTKSYNMYSQIGSKTGVAFYHGNMAEVYLKRKQYDKALESLNLCKNIIYPFNIGGPNAQIDLSFYKIYKELGNWKSAKKHLNEALKNGLKANNKKILYEIYEGLTYVNVKLGEKAEAFDNQTVMLALERAINEQDLELKLQASQYGYDFEQQMNLNKIQTLQLKLEKRRSLAMGVGIIALVLFLVFLYYLYRKIARKNQLIQNQNEKIENMNVQLGQVNNSLERKVEKRTLQLSELNTKLSEINTELADSILIGKTIERKRLASDLHDNLGGIFTALKWNLMAFDISKLEGQNKLIFAKIKDSIDNGYDEIRDISHNLLPKNILNNPLSVAIKNLENDLNVNERISFSLNVDSSVKLNKNDEYEIYLAISELCTNSIKHSDGNQVLISLVVADNKFKLIYFDNGSRFKDYFLTRGMGLQNIEKRLKNVNTTFYLGKNKFSMTEKS